MSDCKYLENCIMAQLTKTCFEKDHIYCGIYLRKEDALSDMETSQEGIQGDSYLIDILRKHEI